MASTDGDELLRIIFFWRAATACRPCRPPAQYISYAYSSTEHPSLFLLCLFHGLSYRPSLFALISLTMSIGAASTGLIVRSKIYTVAGFAGMGLSTLFAFYDFYLKQLSGTTGIDASYLNFEILIFAAIFLVMMVIPGHIINCRAKQEKEKNHGTC